VPSTALAVRACHKSENDALTTENWRLHIENGARWQALRVEMAKLSPTDHA
jgi:hypothetical protein